MATRKEILRQEAIARLREHVTSGTLLRFVRLTPSSFRVYVVGEKHSVMLTRFIATACGYRYNDRNRSETVIVSGHGYNEQAHILRKVSQAIGVESSKLFYEDL